MMKPIRVTGALIAIALASFSCSSPPESPSTTGGGTTDTNCEGRGENFFAGIKKTTVDGQITAEITTADPAPPANADANTWTIKLTAASGAPIAGAEIIGSPFMIDHKHGAPNPISSDLGAGTYKLGPLALRMAGLWSVTLKIATTDGPDEEVVFNFCIPHD